MKEFFVCAVSLQGVSIVYSFAAKVPAMSLPQFGFPERAHAIKVSFQIPKVSGQAVLELQKKSETIVCI